MLTTQAAAIAAAVREADAVRHGTVRGYNAHRAEGSVPCRPCRNAENARIAPRARARMRAMEELRRRHQAEFEEIFTAELAGDLS